MHAWNDNEQIPHPPSTFFMKADLLVKIRPLALMGSEVFEPGFRVLKAKLMRCKQVSLLQDLCLGACFLFKQLVLGVEVYTESS